MQVTPVEDLMAALERSLAEAKKQSAADLAAVEGSGRPDVVVDAQADGDHAAARPAAGDTLTVGQLIEALDGLPADMPVVLEVLGDVIWTAGIVIGPDEVRIVGDEVEA